MVIRLVSVTLLVSVTVLRYVLVLYRVVESTTV